MAKAETVHRILVNSMPKSGTHLLAKVIESLGYCNISKDMGLIQKVLNRLGMSHPKVLSHYNISRNWKLRIYERLHSKSPDKKIPIGVTFPTLVYEKVVSKWLNSITSGCFISGHIPWSQEFDELLKICGFKHIVILRDPRDVLASSINHILNLKLRQNHLLKEDFLKLNGDERIAFLVKGGYAPLCGQNVAGIKDAYRNVLNWRQSENVLFVRFEDLVGTKGGGSHEAQYEAIKKICGYLDIAHDDKKMTEVCGQIFDEKSPTFQKGQIGTWRNVLTKEQLIMFNESCGELLKELYYD